MSSAAPIDPATLTPEHLGRRVWVQWPAAERWETGYIDSIASDQIKILVRLRGGSEVGFSRNTGRREIPSPTLYLVDGPPA